MLHITTTAAMTVPNWMPCAVEPARSMPFCNHTLPTDQRVANLISLMTQEELLSLIHI